MHLHTGLLLDESLIENRILLECDAVETSLVNPVVLPFHDVDFVVRKLLQLTIEFVKQVFKCGILEGVSLEVVGNSLSESVLVYNIHHLLQDS